MPTHIPLHLLLPAIAGIYISQTLLTAMTTQALPALLREAGASLQAVGLAALWWLPWGLKFVWAPWVERLRLPPGRRERRSRPLLLGTQWALALLLLAMGAAGLASEGRALTLAGGAWALALLMLAALVSSAGDVACDGFAIDQLARRQRGWGNVAQVGGGYVGAMLGGGGFLLAAQAVGWPLALAGTAGVMALLSLPLLAVREPPRPEAECAANAANAAAGPSTKRDEIGEMGKTDGGPAAHRPGLLHALHRPAVRQGLWRVALCMAGLRLAMGLPGPLLLDAGMKLERLGWVLGAFSLLAGLAGALAGGWLTRLAPGWRAAQLALAALAAVLAGLTATAVAAVPAALPASLAVTALTVFTGLLFATAGCLWVALYSALMEAASPLQPGVDFTLFQSADALIAAAGGLAAGWLAQRMGYGACLASAALLCAGGAWALAGRESGASPPRRPEGGRGRCA